MSLYWLQPGWKSARCADCGVNIWNSGGDPDWGYCGDCFSARVEGQPRQYIPCDICSKHEAVTGHAGKAVCSQECASEAERIANAH